MQATIFDLTGDAVVYRDLEACDPDLPRLDALRAELGLPAGPPPRKRDQAYAQLALGLAQAAQAARGGPPFLTLAVLGDTENDRLLAAHLRTISPLRSFCFIGEDRPVAAEELSWQGDTASATRWHLIRAWAAQVENRGGDWSRAAIFVDIDKTLLGPRGRSDGAIDDARAEGALVVSSTILGPELDVAAFRRIYADLCHKSWHGFTLDNQDYVVAATLLLATGAYDLEVLRAEAIAGTATLPALLDATATRLHPALHPVYAEIRARVAEGDPTPFKAFRRAELTATLARMADGRLTICGDVFELCQVLATSGALLIAASDKPAESAIPSAEQAAAGVLPLHRTPALVD